MLLLILIYVVVIFIQVYVLSLFSKASSSDDNCELKMFNNLITRFIKNLIVPCGDQIYTIFYEIQNNLTLKNLTLAGGGSGLVIIIQSNNKWTSHNYAKHDIDKFYTTLKDTKHRSFVS